MESLRRSSAMFAPLLAALVQLSCGGSDSITTAPAEVATLTLTAPKQALVVGEAVQLKATPFSAAGNPLSARSVTYVSDHPTVLAVDANGRATGVSKGTATVTATSGGVSNTLAFTVSRAPAVSLAPDSLAFSALSPGKEPAAQTVQVTNAGDGTLSGLSTQISYAAGQPTGWLSAQLGATTAPTTLTVQATRGSLGVGTYRATVTVSGQGAASQALSVRFTVTAAPVATVRVQPDTATLTVGGSRTLTATVQDSAGNVLTGRTVTWSSSDTTVATVVGQGSTATVTGRHHGQATITATSEGKSGTALVTVPSYTLSVTSSGSGSGTITSTPAGISCTVTAGAATGTCQQSFDAGIVVTLTAQPAQGSAFGGFSGACTGSTCQVTISGDAAVTAAFALSSFTITTSSNPAAGGTTGGGGTFTFGQTATVTATPATGYRFTSWTEGGTTVSTQASYSFAVSGNRALVANFTTIAARLLTVTGAGTGSGTVTSTPAGINCTITAGTASGTCQASFQDSTAVTLAATATGGGTFAGFSGACTGTTCQLAMTQDRSVTATFTASYTITTSSNPAAGGTTAGGGTFDAGTSVTVTATPAAGYTFTNWTQDTTVVSTQASYTFTASANRNLVANFTQAPHTLKVAGAGTGSGTVTSTPAGINCTITAGVAAGTCQATFAATASVSLAATPATGSSFTGFSGACSGTTCTVTMSQDRAVTATFALPTVTVSTSSNPAAGGTTTGAGTYNPGSSVTVTATPAAGYLFGNWTQAGAVVSTQPSYTFTVGTTNVALVANFTAIDTLSLALSGSGTGSVTVNGQSYPYAGTPVTRLLTFPAGTGLTLQATAGTGLYFFGGWSGACTGLSAGCTFNISQNSTVGADFERTTVSLTASADTICSAGLKCIHTATDTLTAIARGKTGTAMVFKTTSGLQIASTSTFTTTHDAAGITLYVYKVTWNATGVANATYSVVASTSSGSDTVTSNPVTVVVTSR